MRKKFISFALIFVMLFSMLSLTSCSSKKKSDRWEIDEKEADNIANLDITANKTDDKTSLDVKSSDITFKENISKDDIRILANSYDEQDTDIKEDEDKATSINTEMNEIESFEVTRNNSDEITIDINDNDKNVTAYYLYVHKDGTNESRYASGITGINDMSVEEKSYDIELSDKISMYEENPSIDIKHGDVFKISSDIASDDVNISGSFSGMTVESVDTDENHTVIKLNGKPSVNGQGIIAIPSDKTDCGDLTVKVNVIDTMLSIDNSSFRYEDGKLSFDVKKYNGKFTENDNSKFTINGKELNVDGYSDEGNAVTLSLKTESKDIDSAIADLKDQVLEANGESTESGIDSKGIFYIPDASIQNREKSCDIYSGYAEATLVLYSCDGTFNELDEKSFEFTGEYENCEIESVTRLSDNSYQLKIKIDLKPGMLNDKHITGSVILNDKSIVSNWGSPVPAIESDIDIIVNNGESGFDISFEDVIDKAKNVLSVAGMLGFPSGPFEKILDICGEYAGKADSVSSFAKKCLIFAGIIEEDEDDSPDIFKEVSDLKQSISELKDHITYVENMIQENDNDRRQSDDYIHYADYRAAWKSFYNGELKNMQEIMDNFKTYYDEYIITFMRNSGKSDTATGNINNGTINIYLNKDGKVEVPSTENEAYSLYYSETELKKYVFSPEHFKEACVKYEKNNSEDMIDLILNDSTFESSLAKFNSANGTKIGSDDIRNAIETQAASYAVQKIGATNVIKTYNDYTDALLSDDIMYGNVMETYIKMLSYCYNFQSEAKSDILHMQNYLQMFTIKSSAFASYVSWYSPSYKRNDNPVKTQYEKSMELLEKDYLHDVSLKFRDRYNKRFIIEDYYDWSYILNDKIHATYISGDWMHEPARASASNSESGIVSQKEMQLIYNRYKDMVNRKRIAIDNFYDYLAGKNIIVSSRKDEFTDAYVAVRYEKEAVIDTEADYAIENVTGKYFTRGQTYVVGSGKFGNDNKASQKYIINPSTQYRVGYKLNEVMNPEEKTRRKSYFNYYESHWYWSPNITTNEVATFRKYYDMRDIIFTKGDVSSEIYEGYDYAGKYKDDYTWISLEN